MPNGPNFASFNTSAKGMSIQKKRMNLVTENIANSSTTKTDDGLPYKRKFLNVQQEESAALKYNLTSGAIKMKSTKSGHFQLGKQMEISKSDMPGKIDMNESKDFSDGDKVFMPDHPDANEQGYVQMPNVNIITEMVDMIAATRSYEANLTAFNATKQIAKDSLEI